MAARTRHTAKQLDRRSTELPTITVHVPMQLRRRSGRKAIATGDGSRSVRLPSPNRIDPLLAALARAFYWRKLIETGAHASVAEIAAAQGVSAAYVSRTLRLTLLSPATTMAALDKKQSSVEAWSLEALSKPLPAQWECQIARR